MTTLPRRTWLADAPADRERVCAGAVDIDFADDDGALNDAR